MKIQTLLTIAVLLAGGAVAQDLGQPTSSTPYDKYLGPLRATMSALGSQSPGVDVVKQYVRTGRGFRYLNEGPLRAADTC